MACRDGVLSISKSVDVTWCDVKCEGRMRLCGVVVVVDV